MRFLPWPPEAATSGTIMGQAHYFAWLLLAAGVLAALVTGCGKGTIEDTPALPPVDALEPAVAAKLKEVHAQAVADPSARNWARYAKTLHAHRMNREAAPVYLMAAEHSEGLEKFEILYLAGYACTEWDPERAIEVFEQALKLRDDYAPLHLRLGALHETAQRYEDARRHFQRGLDLSAGASSSDALLGLGRVHLAEGRISEAIALLERTGAADPEHSEVYVALAVAYTRSGRKQDAARATTLAGDIEEAHDFADPIASSMNREGVSYWSLHSRGSATVKAGRVEEGLALLNRALEVRPDHLDGLASQANALVRLGRYAEAESIADRVLARRPESLGAITVKAACAQSRGLPTAISWLRRGLEINPRHVLIRENLGRCLRSMNQLAEAKEHFRFVLERKPHRWDLCLELVSILVEEGQRTEALAGLDQILLAQPSNAKALALKKRLSE